MSIVTSEGFPLQNIIFFVVTSSINGGWLEIRCAKTNRLIRTKSFQDVEQLEAMKERAIVEVVTARLKLDLGLVS